MLATADEETSMQGAQALAELGRPKARSAVIGEPTGMRPVRSHKGMIMDSIRLQGQSGHSSDPALGNNALDAMHAVITELMAYRQELKTRYHDELFTIPHPTLNLGCIHGGDNPNRICGHCELEFDLRLMPGMHTDSVRAEIRQRILRITEPLGVGFDMVPLFTGIPAFFTDADSPILKTAEKLTGHTGISVAFGTEGPFLQQLGMDTIVMGPGNIDQAHQPDEYVSQDMLNPCIPGIAGADHQSLPAGLNRVWLTAAKLHGSDAMSSEMDMVEWFRASAAYINAHRGKTFVVLLSGEALQDDNFDNIIYDLSLLRSLGVRLVLVHGSRPQITASLEAAGLVSEYHRDLRITPAASLERIKPVVAGLSVELEARFTMGLSNSPMHGADIRLVRGNFVTAKPVGVHNGVDYQYTGKVRRIHHQAIQKQLAEDNLVLLSNLGYSVTGE